MIEVKNLTKRYGQHKAVDNISFKVDDGEIVGFLGLNGAGKTTTMNIMTGYISSTDGIVLINGYDILEEPENAKRQIGYLPDTPPVYGDMSVMEYLNFVCDIKNVKKKEKKDMINDIINIVKIDEVKNRIIKNLSKGYRQRVGLAQALIGYPKVLILDEPTVGLDPRQIIEIRDVIKKLGKKHTIILSSHILSEVSAVCDRIIIINRGKIVADRVKNDLDNNIIGNGELSAKIKGNINTIKNAFEKCDYIDNFKVDFSDEESVFNVTIKSKENADIREHIFDICVENDFKLLMFKASSLNLEEIFLNVTAGELAEEKGGEN